MLRLNGDGLRMIQKSKDGMGMMSEFDTAHRKVLKALEGFNSRWQDSTPTMKC